MVTTKFLLPIWEGVWFSTLPDKARLFFMYCLHKANAFGIAHLQPAEIAGFSDSTSFQVADLLQLINSEPVPHLLKMDEFKGGPHDIFDGLTFLCTDIFKVSYGDVFNPRSNNQLGFLRFWINNKMDLRLLKIDLGGFAHLDQQQLEKIALVKDKNIIADIFYSHHFDIPDGTPLVTDKRIRHYTPAEPAPAQLDIQELVSKVTASTVKEVISSLKLNGVFNETTSPSHESFMQDASKPHEVLRKFPLNFDASVGKDSVNNNETNMEKSLNNDDINMEDSLNETENNIESSLKENDGLMKVASNFNYNAMNNSLIVDEYFSKIPSKVNEFNNNISLWQNESFNKIASKQNENNIKVSSNNNETFNNISLNKNEDVSLLSLKQNESFSEGSLNTHETFRSDKYLKSVRKYCSLDYESFLVAYAPHSISREDFEAYKQFNGIIDDNEEAKQKLNKQVGQDFGYADYSYIRTVSDQLGPKDFVSLKKKYSMSFLVEGLNRIVLKMNNRERYLSVNNMMIQAVKWVDEDYRRDTQKMHPEEIKKYRLRRDPPKTRYEYIKGSGRIYKNGKQTDLIDYTNNQMIYERMSKTELFKRPYDEIEEWKNSAEYMEFFGDDTINLPNETRENFLISYETIEQ